MSFDQNPGGFAAPALPFGSGPRQTLNAKLRDLHWRFLFMLIALALAGIAMLFSVANGSFDPWASRQLSRFAVAFVLLIAIALVHPRVWITLAYPAYAACLIALAGVEYFGESVMGAKRWLDLGVIRLQPSELMKIALVVALARYFHCLNFDRISHLRPLFIPLLLAAAPVLLAARQPDLGTAVLLAVIGAGMFFLAGVGMRYFAAASLAAAALAPLAWRFLLHDYQKARLLSFLSPERDPLGAGYHILQSKIAFGAGGLFGRGFLKGTQSQLNFIPEKQTDFVFTMLGEEFGLAGGLVILALYAGMIAAAFAIALQSRNHFGRLLAQGFAGILFIQVFINIAMVMGLLPVVGVPLPFLSYGGSSLLTMMIGAGLLMSVHVHRQAEISRTPAATLR